MMERDQRDPPGASSGETPIASVIVVEHGTAPHLERCLRALEASELGGRPFELIVVDNASPTPCDALHDAFPRARFVHLRRNLGFAGGCAVGLARARADVVATVNPDAVVEPEWLARVLATFDADPTIGVVGAKLLGQGDVLAHVGGRLLPNGRSEHLGRGERDRGQHDRRRDVEYVCGAALAVRRATIDEVGFFSPVYHPAYYEDAELCVRARAAGWRVVVAPDARARHAEATASGGARSDAYLRRYHAGRARFVRRNVPRRSWLTGVLPAELRLLASVSRRERSICARAWIHGLRSAHDETAGRARAGDVIRERAPVEPDGGARGRVPDARGGPA